MKWNIAAWTHSSVVGSDCALEYYFFDGDKMDLGPCTLWCDLKAMPKFFCDCVVKKAESEGHINFFPERQSLWHVTSHQGCYSWLCQGIREATAEVRECRVKWFISHAPWISMCLILEGNSGISMTFTSLLLWRLFPGECKMRPIFLDFSTLSCTFNMVIPCQTNTLFSRQLFDFAYIWCVGTPT